MSLIYHFILLILSVSAILEYSNGEKSSKLWFYSVITLMAFTAGLAFGVSPDWIPYYHAFEGIALQSYSNISDFAEGVAMESGYILENKIFSTLGIGFGGFLLIHECVSLGMKASSMYKYSAGYPFLVLILYFIPTYLFEDHVHIRQSMAAAISIYSIRYVIDRKLFKFLLCSFIAFQFHKSSIVFILAYWVVKFEFKTVHLGLLVLLAILAQIFGISTYLDGILSMLPFGIGDKVEDYESNLGMQDGVAIGDIVKVVTVIIIMFYDVAARKADEHYVAFRNLFVLGVVMYFFFGKGIFGIRLPAYYTTYLIFVVPRLVKGVTNKSFKTMLFAFFMLYVFLVYNRFVVSQVNRGRQGFANYQTLFDDSCPYGFFYNEI